MNRRALPSWVKRVLRFMTNQESYEYLCGDIEELYNQRYRGRGRLSAYVHLLRDLLSEVQLNQIAKKPRIAPGVRLELLFMTVRQTTRTLKSDTAFTLVSLLVLTLGLSSFFLLSLFIDNELSFDAVTSPSVYRIYADVENENAEKSYASVPAPLGPAVQGTIPEIEQVARICKFREMGTYSPSEEVTFKDSYLWADPQFLALLDYEMIAGNPGTALSQPRTVVLTESAAKRYFGSTDPLGQVLQFKTLFHEDVPMTVTGVIKDPPSNSHLQFEILNSFKTLESDHFRDIIDSWDIYYYYTYVRLSEGALSESVALKIDRVMADHTEERESETATYSLQKIRDIYVHPLDDGTELGPISNIRYTYFFGVLAILILCMSAVNYANLYTVRSFKRQKEIGLRKTMGATRLEIFLQLILESWILSTIALLASIGAVYFALPVVNGWFGRSMTFDLVEDYRLLIALIGASYLIGFISTNYTAIALSRIQPSATIRVKYAANGNSILKKSLVVLQFAFATLILFSSAVVQRQMEFVFNSELGFNADELLIMPFGTQETVGKYELLKEALEAESEVVGFSAASQYVGSPQLFGEDFEITHPISNEQLSISSLRFEVSPDYLKVIEADFISGRNFDTSFETDLDQAVVVNASFLKEAGITEIDQMMGQTLNVSFNWGEERSMKVIGVIEDFKMESLHSQISPAAFYLRPDELYFGHLRLASSANRMTLEKIEAITREISPTIPFELFTQNDRIDLLYAQDRQFQFLLRYFTLLSVFIACLGIFSFSLYMVRQRTREIGIRKVLGARTSQLATKLVLGFLSLVIISLCLSLPLAHFLTESWLESFSYRSPSSVSTYLMVSALLISLTAVTVFFHSLTAARVNPATTLKGE